MKQTRLYYEKTSGALRRRIVESPGGRLHVRAALAADEATGVAPGVVELERPAAAPRRDPVRPAVREKRQRLAERVERADLAELRRFLLHLVERGRFDGMDEGS